jgi:hypothetical protein
MPFERTPSSGPPASLLRPPPARIVVPPSTSAGLAQEPARAFAGELAKALQEIEIPATSAGVRNPQYSLLVAGEAEAGQMRLTYSLAGADGRPIASAGGPRPVPAGAWSTANQATLAAAAKEAAPAIARMLASVDAAQRESTTGALTSRLPSAAVAPITGAPGDGARSLDRAIRAALEREGVVVTEGAATAEFRVTGQVVMATLPPNRQRGNQQRVEITWIIARADGLELGRVAQLNEVPRGSLDGLWGDVAPIVADQAAAGVVEVINRHRNGG